jgi:primosomal protein N'
MAATPYIQVIVPLRLEWEPYYVLEGAVVGDRVQVVLAHREYVGVVSAVNVVPETAPERIQEARLTDLPPVHPREIIFWRAIAGYYLCSVGEVYKAAYPAFKPGRKPKERDGEKAPQDLVLTPEQEKAADEIRMGFQAGKTVLLQGSGKTEVYLQLARETLALGRSVLYLVPEISLSKHLQDRIASHFPRALFYHSGRTIAQRRNVADAIREGKAELVLGTRSALFLPHRNLGLIILDEEQDMSYKQDSPAPRYQARESAILLSGIHQAQVLLGSSTPSLESLYNAETGKFIKVDLKNHSQSNGADILLVNTAAEVRKKGMSGSFSFKLLEQIRACLDAGEKVLLVCRSKASIPECTEELEGLFGSIPKGIVPSTPASAKGQPVGAFGLTAVLQADSLLAKEDFRCDERAIQVLRQLRERCKSGGCFVIQTWEAAHPVFKEFTRDHTLQLLAERRQFGYPPYSRLINIQIKDNNEKRGPYMARELESALKQVIPSPVRNETLIRILLPRDKSLLTRKQALYSTVTAFEKALKYTGHIIIDVDPV